MTWLVVVYLGSIVAMFVSAFWTVDSFTENVVHQFSTVNFHTVFTEPLYRKIALRTLGIALAVTAIDVLVAFPLAFYMSVVASRRLRNLLVVAVLTPLWASYLVKAFAWRTLFAPDGPIGWVTGGHGPDYGKATLVVTLAYMWLPYMVIPIYAGFERMPKSLFEASADLGAGAVRTVRAIVLPLVFPAIAAGSIFTFSLTLGDYIAVGIVGGKTQLIANVISEDVVLNQPLAATVALIPLVAIVLYLVAMRRTGALENV
ncbi:MAG: putative spermidine/putrescine transport system permease protein [Pseudonocardiales bacterium]|nr:putative spermidine/putrescine transport system permease protein [Pseudonocardiales bacterium]